MANYIVMTLGMDCPICLFGDCTNNRDKCVLGTECIFFNPYYYQCNEPRTLPTTNCVPTNGYGCAGAGKSCCNPAATCTQGLCKLNQVCIWYPPYTPPPTSAPKPSSKPTTKPSYKPSTIPTRKPSVKPSAAPTAKPSAKPTAKPTTKPSAKPSVKPTVKPTAKPSVKPTGRPTAKPTTNKPK